MARPESVRALFGRRVRALRKLRQITQFELGERAALSGKFVGLVERGLANPSLEAIAGMARALRVEPWELLRFEEARPEGPPQRAARAFHAMEQVSEYLSRRPPGEIEHALRLMKVALDDRTDDAGA